MGLFAVAVAARWIALPALPALLSVRCFSAPARRVASLEVGIIGVPNVGKSTIFNALTNGKAEAANFPFCMPASASEAYRAGTIDPNMGVMKVADPTLKLITKYVPAKRIVPAEVRVTDIAGLVKGASKGAGLGNKFLSHIRQDDTVTHVDGTVDPVRDADVIHTELILSDAQMVERALLRKKNASDESLKRLFAWLADGNSARDLPATPENADVKAAGDAMGLLSAKPLLFVGNMSEAQIGQLADNKDAVPAFSALTRAALAHGQPQPLAICAPLEHQLLALESEDDRLELLQAVGLSESAVGAISRAVYRLLGLLSFYTAGEVEARAWSVRAGATAQDAAGRIHSDIAKGFIRAETYNVRDLVSAGSVAAVRTRHEGRGYVVDEGDVFNFLFKA